MARNLVRKQVAHSVCVLGRELKVTISSVVLTDAELLATSYAWNKAAEEYVEQTANSIPAGVKNKTTMKLTGSHCCFVCQTISYALTANKSETCRSALTGSASLVMPVQITTHTT